METKKFQPEIYINVYYRDEEGREQSIRVCNDVCSINDATQRLGKAIEKIKTMERESTADIPI